MGGVEETTVRVGTSTVRLLGLCQGLEGEAERACRVIGEHQPDVVALALDPELAPRFAELDGGHVLDARDQAYRQGLSEFGEVTLPSPGYRAAIELADEIGADVEGVDLPEPEYMDDYLASVGVLELAKRALQLRWMNVRPPRAEDAAEFCRAFDERLNSGPFGRLQRRREERMAEDLASLAPEASIVHLVEVERLDGVTRALEARVEGPDPRA
jgi:hypothetical protein